MLILSLIISNFPLFKDKIDIIKFIKHNDIPFNSKTYSIARTRFLNGTLYTNDNKVLKKVKADISYEDTVELLVNSLFDGNCEAILIDTSYESVLNEEHSDKFKQMKLIEEVDIVENVNVLESDVDITKDPFAFYLSGIDTSGNVASKARSDVNIVVAVNPKTKNVLMINTPRDYYVTLHSKGKKDKLTHSGIFGIETSLATVGDIFDILHFFILLIFIFRNVFAILSVFLTPSSFTIFALGVSPYITAQIIIQLLQKDVLPALTELSKQGQYGRKKTEMATRYLTLLLGAVQAYGIIKTMENSNYITLNAAGSETVWLSYIYIVIVMMSGSMLVMWLGDQISVKGIGNGISMIIFAGIVARIPSGIRSVFTAVKAGNVSIITLIILL